MGCCCPHALPLGIVAPQMCQNCVVLLPLVHHGSLTFGHLPRLYYGGVRVVLCWVGVSYLDANSAFAEGV